MSFELAPATLQALQMGASFAFTLGVLYLYVSERVPMEITSVAAICVLMVFFHFLPVPDTDGGNRLDVKVLLSGFANPALMTVLALLVVGQGMVRTGILERGARLMLRLLGPRPRLSIVLTMTTVTVVSAVLNNIPVVVIFIPILQSITERLDIPPGKVMMGLSFTAALGGSMTLIGSGSNLLVSGEMMAMGERALGFFEFSLPAALLAFIGLVYVLIVGPRLLHDRRSLAERIMDRSGAYFLAQIPVHEGSRLAGATIVGGVLTDIPDVRVRMVLRGERAATPPFHGFRLDPGDQVIVAASRKALTAAMSDHPGLLSPPPPLVPRGVADEAESEPWHADERMLAEVMIPPGSAFANRRLYQTAFQFRTRCAVLGIQRRSHMFRSRITDIFLEPGDVLLIQGRPEDIKALRGDREVVLMSGSRADLPKHKGAKKALFIFLAIVAAAGSGLLPVSVAALGGAAAMVGLGVLNVRQASRAVDTRIFTMIPATLALGAALHETGGAEFLASSLSALLEDAGPLVMLSGFFLMMALLSNIVGSNASAVLFTPIAVGLARETLLDPHVFAIAVVLASNCAFATPIGYQTSLLVMGPGHYRFGDFPRAGLPLIFLLWIAYTVYAGLAYGF